MIKIAAMALIALTMTGCSLFRDLYGIDARELDTARKNIAFGYLQVDELRKLTQSMLAADVIGADDAQRVKDHLTRAFDILETARTAVDVAGDPVAAGSALERAQRAIALALEVLREFAPPDIVAAFERIGKNDHSDYKGARRAPGDRGAYCG